METSNMETTTRAVDWKAVEADFRTSSRSTRAIGSTHGVSHTAILNRARAEGWRRADGAPPVEVESDAAAQTSAEDSAEVAKEAVANESTSEITTQAVDGEPVSNAVSNDDLADAVLDRAARIHLTRKQTEGLPLLAREPAKGVTVAEADDHRDFRAPIAALKIRRRAAILRHRQHVAQNVAAIESAKRAVERIEALRLERAALDDKHSVLATAFAKGQRDAAALADHRRAVESVDDQLTALKVAVPLLEMEAQRMMNAGEFVARDPDEVAQELANIRGEAACAIGREIARAKWG